MLSTQSQTQLQPKHKEKQIVGAIAATTSRIASQLMPQQCIRLLHAVFKIPKITDTQTICVCVEATGCLSK